jgi:hypothetical protein
LNVVFNIFSSRDFQLSCNCGFIRFLFIGLNKMNCELMLTYDTPALRPCFVTFFSATIDGRDQLFGHKLHIGSPYRGKRFWTRQIPTSCLPILLIFIHICN